jgi:hypothetical protein
VTVQELLALARVLDVPPVWLLTDQATGKVPVADGAEPDVWSALLWIIGKQPLDHEQRAGGAWSDAAWVVERMWDITTAVTVLENRRYAQPVNQLGPNFDPVMAKEMHDRTDRMLVDRISEYLGWLTKAGITPPPLPAYVLHRAKELNVNLAVED